MRTWETIKLAWKAARAFGGKVPIWLWLATAGVSAAGYGVHRVYKWDADNVREAKQDTASVILARSDSIAHVYGATEHALADSIARLDTVIAGQRASLRATNGHTRTLAATVDSQARRVDSLIAGRVPVNASDTALTRETRALTAGVHILRDSVSVLSVRVTALDDSLHARDVVEVKRRAEQLEEFNRFARDRLAMSDSLQRSKSRELTFTKGAAIGGGTYGIIRLAEFIINRVRKK